MHSTHRGRAVAAQCRRRAVLLRDFCKVAEYVGLHDHAARRAGCYRPGAAVRSFVIAVSLLTDPCCRRMLCCKVNHRFASGPPSQ
jgi:hypothetical protein